MEEFVGEESFFENANFEDRKLGHRRRRLAESRICCLTYFLKHKCMKRTPTMR